MKVNVVALVTPMLASGWAPLLRSTFGSKRLFRVVSNESPIHKLTRTTDCNTAVLFSKVESFTLERLSPDHDSVGQELADSLQKMLDTEWMPQGVHAEVAENVKITYITCRNNGEDDLMAIMMATASNLSDRWTSDWESNLFVNVWDIANYVSDFLTTKSGETGCNCTLTIY